MFAQSLVEYGALSSVIAGGQQFANDVITWIANRHQFTWIALGAVIFAWFVFFRPRSPRF